MSNYINVPTHEVAKTKWNRVESIAYSGEMKEVQPGSSEPVQFAVYKGKGDDKIVYLGDTYVERWCHRTSSYWYDIPAAIVFIRDTEEVSIRRIKQTRHGRTVSGRSGTSNLDKLEKTVYFTLAESWEV